MVNFYPFHIGDYASATAHLTWEEDLAYRRLLDLYYTTEKSIPPDERAVFRLTRANTTEQREAIGAVLKEYFTPTDAGWIHKRCEEEIAKVHEKKAKAKQSAEQRWKGNATVSENASERINEQSERIEPDSDRNATNPNPNPKTITKTNPNNSEAAGGGGEGGGGFVAAKPKHMTVKPAKKNPEKARQPLHLPRFGGARDAVAKNAPELMGKFESLDDFGKARLDLVFDRLGPSGVIKGLQELRHDGRSNQEKTA